MNEAESAASGEGAGIRAKSTHKLGLSPSQRETTGGIRLEAYPCLRKEEDV